MAAEDAAAIKAVLALYWICCGLGLVLFVRNMHCMMRTGVQRQTAPVEDGPGGSKHALNVAVGDVADHV
jgi:hypothetical protein